MLLEDALSILNLSWIVYFLQSYASIYVQYDLNVVSIQILFIIFKYFHRHRTWQMFLFMNFLIDKSLNWFHYWMNHNCLLNDAKIIELSKDIIIDSKDNCDSSGQLLSINEWQIHNKWWLMIFCITMNFKLHIKSIF